MADKAKKIVESMKEVEEPELVAFMIADRQIMASNIDEAIKIAQEVK